MFRQALRTEGVLGQSTLELAVRSSERFMLKPTPFSMIFHDFPLFSFGFLITNSRMLWVSSQKGRWRCRCRFRAGSGKVPEGSGQGRWRFRARFRAGSGRFRPGAVEVPDYDS